MITNFALTQQNVNVNPTTGVRYGVINGNSLPDWIWDNIEYRYPTPWDCSHSETCNCGDINELEMPDMEATELYIDKHDLQLSFDPNSNIAMIFKSDLIVKCRLCSPCYPNAGNLDQLDMNGYATYGLSN